MNLKKAVAVLAVSILICCGCDTRISDSGVEISIMSYNVHHCEGGDLVSYSSTIPVAFSQKKSIL